MNSRGLKKKLNLSLFTILISVIIAVWNIYNINLWKTQGRVIAWDIISYYAYLPATFIYHDATLKFLDKGNPYPEVIFWPNRTSKNQYVIKTSMGMSYMYAPFFFIAHATAGLTDQNPSGFSPHYKFFIVLSGICYFIIGLVFLRKILLRYFNQLVTSLTILVIVFGTNLFYYTSIEVAMPHVYLFALTTLFIFLTIKWYESHRIILTIMLGILSGIISLIRPTNIVVILFFIFWDIRSMNNFRDRFFLFRKYFHHLILIAILSTAVWVPQFLYWKAATGHWLFFSYIGEKFYFLRPQIVNGLFSFRKGWLIYTPVMVFSIAGIPLLWKRRKECFWPVLLLLCAHVYIIYSWWCWWYGGSLGSRPMIDIYGLLALPMASFLEWILERRKWIRLSFLLFFLLTAARGGLYNIQYYYGSIHWDGMTKEAFFKSFFKIKKIKELDELIKIPDYETAKKGEEKYFLN